jgi:5-methylthioadenosine/S-adenosylhomocysteine deaminase
MALVVSGTRVVTFDDDRRVVPDGSVYINDGVIEAVQPRRAAAPAGYTRARRVATGGVVYPGLVDLHNHLAYNFLPLWTAPKEEPYTSRHQWPNAATYGRDISDPAQAMGIAAAAATLRYAEVRAAAGGVTAIQGSPPVTRAFPGWMVRNIEKETFPDRDGQLVYQRVIKTDVKGLKPYAGRLQAGASFVYHLAEGTDPDLRSEYDDLREAGCVQAGLIGIHSTALGAREYREWGADPGAVVWSPFSNLWLYGDTTNVVAARRHGHLVCLGSDWGPSGTRNLLGELKVAALWNDVALGGALSPLELCETATANPGQALTRCWGHDVGRLQPGALGDVFAASTRDSDPYRNLLRVSERHVRFVAVGGRPVYGNRSLLRAAGAKNLERIRVAGIERAIVMRLPPELTPENPVLAAEANQSWKDAMADLQAVVDDPAGAVRAARQRAPRGGVAPLEFVPDMPGPGNTAARALTDEELDRLAMLPIESLAHDASWFDTVERGRPHTAPLRRVREYFR